MSDEPSESTANKGQPALTHDSDALRSREFRHDVLLVVTTGFLSLSGVGLGTFLSSRSGLSRWEREANRAQRLEVLHKRMELLERTVRVFSQL